MNDEARVSRLDPVRARASSDAESPPCAQDLRSPRDREGPPYAHPDHRREAGFSAAGTDLCGPTYAALDLGTNNCRLRMAAPDARGGLRVVDGYSRIVRLGEGLSQTGKLGEAAMARAYQALKACAERIEARAPDAVGCVATQACRIAANGDTANKIGTYSVAILARAHDIPFYVAAPVTTFDLAIQSGREIPIEERAPEELTHGLGCETAPSGAAAYNPAFDVTPAELITAIITDRGVIRPVTTDSIGRLLQ